MRRVIAYLDWKARTWRDLVVARPNEDEALVRGLQAYAYRQANVFESMAATFAAQWTPVLTSKNIPIEWPSRFHLVDSSKLAGPS
jgi:hypothetical protein